MKVRLTALAERQLRELPVPAARKVVKALRLLEAAPRSGRAYPDDSPFRGLRYRVVIVRARRWTYRLTYEVLDDELWVYYVAPAWYPPTHGSRGDE